MCQKVLDYDLKSLVFFNLYHCNDIFRCYIHIPSHTSYFILRNFIENDESKTLKIKTIKKFQYKKSGILLNYPYYHLGHLSFSLYSSIHHKFHTLIPFLFAIWSLLGTKLDSFHFEFHLGLYRLRFLYSANKNSNSNQKKWKETKS